MIDPQSIDPRFLNCYLLHRFPAAPPAARLVQSPRLLRSIRRRGLRRRTVQPSADSIYLCHEPLNKCSVVNSKASATSVSTSLVAQNGLLHRFLCTGRTPTELDLIAALRLIARSERKRQLITSDGKSCAVQYPSHDEGAWAL